MEEFEKIATDEERKRSKRHLVLMTSILFLLMFGFNSIAFYSDFMIGGFQALLGTPLIAFGITTIAFVIILVVGARRGNEVKALRLTVSDSDIVLDYGPRKFSVRLDKIKRVTFIKSPGGRLIQVALIEFKNKLVIGGFEEMEAVKAAIMKRLEGSEVKVKESVDKEKPLLKLFYLLIPLAILIYCQIFTGTIFPVVFLIVPVMLLITMFVLIKNSVKVKD